MSEPLRVGLVGAGWVATDRYLPALRRRRDVELVAVCDRHTDRASAAAARFGAGRSCDRLDDLLALDVDAVVVCTPPWTHAAIVAAALERGTSVLVEKPMAMNEREAAEMAGAAARTGRMLCVSHNLLFSRSVRAAGRWLAGGGRLLAVGTQLSAPTRRLPSWHGAMPGGLLLDESPHLLYLLQRFLGPLTVEQTRVSAGAKEVDIWLAGERGTARVTMAFESPVSEWHLTLVAPDQVVDVDLFRDIAVRIGPDGRHRPRDIARTSATALARHTAGFASSGTRYALGRQSWGHAELIDRFVRSATMGGPPPVPLAEAVAVVRVADAVLAAVDGVGLDVPDIYR